jgi:hypothetical protein
MPIKSIDFPDNEIYLQVKAEASFNDQKIGDFIGTLLEHWDKTNKKRK